MSPHQRFVYIEIVAGSRETRDQHYNAPLIYRIQKSLLTQNTCQRSPNVEKRANGELNNELKVYVYWY